MADLTAHANRLLGWARNQGESGLRVAGLSDERAVQELVTAGLVREERDELAVGYSGRIYPVQHE